LAHAAQLALSLPAVSQISSPAETPDRRTIIDGSNTVTGYRLSSDAQALLHDKASWSPVPAERTAYMLADVDATAIRVRTATPRKCEAGGDPAGEGTSDLS
jgi:hypothetical protein